MNSVNLVWKIAGTPKLMYHNNQAQAQFTVSITRPNGKEDLIPCCTYDKAAELFYGYMEAGNRIEVVGFLSSSESGMIVVARYVKPIDEHQKEQDPLMRGINYARPVSRITS